jgi:hypothetical protein
MASPDNRRGGVVSALALGAALEETERSAVALFIALTAARSQLAGGLLLRYVRGLSTSDRAKLAAFEREWRERVGRPCGPRSQSEFLKPSALAGLWIWSRDFQNRLLKWDWHQVRTTRDKPFVTSDQPVFGQQPAGLNLRLVTFPVSSEVALVMTDGGQFNEARCPESDARAMNRGTIERAGEFIVACGEGFPAYEHLKRRAGRY